MSDPRGQIAVRHYGQAGPLLGVLHGGPGAPGSLAPLARLLSAQFRVVEPLQRSGGSQPLTVEVHVTDLAQIAREPMLWLGHSWGAMLALSFAARHPELVKAIALVGCGTYDEPTRLTYRDRMRTRMTALGATAHADALRARLAVTADAAERERLRTELGRIAADVMTVDALEPTWLERIDATSNSETWNDVLRLQREGIEPAAFATIARPVLMLHGDDDPHPGEQTRDVLKRVIPQLEYVSFPRCGHEPWRERQASQPFLRTLRTWLLAHATS